MNKDNLTKLDLAKNSNKISGLSVSVTKKLVDDLLKILSFNIKNNTTILKNVGTFKTVNKNKRIGRNPKTMEPFIIKARKSIIFVSSKKLQETLNK